MKNFLIISSLLALGCCCTACKKSEEAPTPVNHNVLAVFTSPEPDQSPYNYADLDYPKGIAVDLSGNVYVADVERKVILKTGFFRESETFATGFSNPTGVAVDNLGNVYVADAGDHVIYKITPEGVSSVLAGSGNPDYVNGTGTGASFDQPTSLAVDVYGNVFVTEPYYAAIRKITPEGAVTTYLDPIQQMANGMFHGEEFLNRPYGIAEHNGILYVTDGNKVLKITSDGYATKAHQGNSPFKTAAAIAVDAKGNLYVSDSGDWSIHKINKYGYVSRIFKEQGSPTDSDPSKVKIMEYCYGIAVLDDKLLMTSSFGYIFQFFKMVY